MDDAKLNEQEKKVIFKDEAEMPLEKPETCSGQQILGS